MIRYAHFTAYTCPGIYRQGEPETLCSYVGSEDPPEYCPLHGGHYFVLRSQMIAQPRDPSLMGWQYGDES